MLKHARRSWYAKATAAVAAAAAALTAGIVALTAAPASAATIPQFDHVVIVVHENTNYESVVGSSQLPYINTLINGGASFTNFHGETHPSQGNYFAMFSGATQGATLDQCPEPGSPYTADNLGKQLIDKGKTFGSYNEDWDGNPATCTTAKYARKHNPWFAFSNVPTSTAKKMTDFPTDYNQLPTVSFVVPNLCNDMHDLGCTTTGDTWTRTKLDGYAQWAKTHNSLLIVTWDEDAFRSQNQIATIFYGAKVKPGTYGTNYNHYNMLRTLQDMYGLRTSGQSTNATPITEVWEDTPANPPVVANPGPQASSVGQAVNLPLQVSSGTAPYTCTVTGLPPGLSNPPGTGCTVQGTPSTAGTFNVTATAKDAQNQNSAPVSFSWTVTGGGNTVPSITNPGNQTSAQGQPVNLQIQVAGNPAPTCTASGLPTGLSISTSCLVTGTPTVLGDSSATVTATNSQGTDSETFLWSVTGGGGTAPTVTSPGNQSTQAGTAVNLQIQRTGTPAPTCAAGGLPAGLSINAGTCAITGTPTTAGTSNVTVTATNSAGSATASFTWTVTAQPPTGVQVANPGPQSSKFNQKVNLTIQVSGGTGPYQCSASGLPAGLWLNPFNCQISGSAWGVGTASVTVTGRDSAGATGSATFPWTVSWF